MDNSGAVADRTAPRMRFDSGMPALSRALLDATRPHCELRLGDLPFAALGWRARDRLCLAANELFGRLAGTAAPSVAGRALADLLEWGDSEPGPGCREVGVRGPGAQPLVMRMLCLPVAFGGDSALLGLFLERGGQGWRHADLAVAIDDVIREQMQWFSGAVLERLARSRAPAAREAGLGELTPREREVLAMVCEGHGDAHIAAQLGISRNTVRNHLSNIYGKANVRRRSEAVVWGRERGIAAG